METGLDDLLIEVQQETLELGSIFTGSDGLFSIRQNFDPIKMWFSILKLRYDYVTICAQCNISSLRRA